jgi:hypothetical protein
LYNAIDAQRTARGLTWRETMQQINVKTGRESIHPISASTVTNLRTKAIAEGDGVLQMLRWLGRMPESFIPGYPADPETLKMPPIPSDKVLRFDTIKLHAALNAQRIERRLTWQQVALEIGEMSAAGLTHLKKGGRTGFPFVSRMSRWLGRPALDFTRLSNF